LHYQRIGLTNRIVDLDLDFNQIPNFLETEDAASALLDHMGQLVSDQRLPCPSVGPEFALAEHDFAPVGIGLGAQMERADAASLGLEWPRLNSIASLRDCRATDLPPFYNWETKGSN